MMAERWTELCSPMPPYRGPNGEPTLTMARAKFYANCSRVFGWGWNLDVAPIRPPATKAGRDAAPIEIQKYGHVGIASYRDQASDAITWLILNKHLNSKVDWPRTEEKLEQAWSDGNARHSTAQELERLFEKAELTPLRSPDLGGVPGGSFGSRYVGVSKIAAQMIVQDIRREMPAPLMELLEKIFIKNEHPWHGQTKKAQDTVFQQVRMALDFAAWATMKSKLGNAAAVEEKRIDLCARWPEVAHFFYRRQLQTSLHMGRVASKARAK